MTISPDGNDGEADGDSGQEALGQASPQLQREPIKAPSRIVWGYLSCLTPAVTFAIGMGAYIWAAVDDFRVLNEKTVTFVARTFIVTECASGIGFGITGIVRDQRKRAYAYWELFLSVMLATMLVTV